MHPPTPRSLAEKRCLLRRLATAELLLSNKSRGSRSSDCLLQTQWVIWACITYSEQSQFQYYRKFQIWTLRKIQFPFAESQIPHVSPTILFRRLLPTECRDGSPAACEYCAKRISLSPNASFRSHLALGGRRLLTSCLLGEEEVRMALPPQIPFRHSPPCEEFYAGRESSLGLQNYGAHHQER